MAISSIGVGSGLPLAELLDNLRTTQETRLTPIVSRQKSAEARITAYGQLKSELSNLSTAAQSLLGDAFDSMKTTVTGTDFKAEATTHALAGNYTLKVGGLASAQSLVMTGQASRTENIGSGGMIHFTINGATTSVDLSTTGSSLENIVSAINGTSDLGVQATILNNGTGTPHQLILTSKETGTQAAVSAITVTGNGALESVLQFGTAGSTVAETAAADAHIAINGVDIVSQNNTIKNVVDGVTLTLNNVSTTSQALEVSGDSQGVTDAIKTFVDRYNDVLKKVKQVTNYDAEKKTGSALTGDSLARSIQSKLSGILNTTSSTGAFNMLSEIGIRTDPMTGLLNIEESVLTTALVETPSDVQALFRNEAGVAKKALAIANSFTDSSNGLLTTASEGASAQLKDLALQYSRTELRIEAQMEIYRKQFTAMDSLVAQMNSTSSYLTQQLSKLGTSAT